VHAKVGDEIVVDAVHTDEPSRKGEILEVSETGGVEHYVVQWDDGKRTVFFPGSTSHVVAVKPGRT
jgi:hypothetical protein